MTLRSIGVFALLAPLFAEPASAANWTDYRSGPLHVISNAGDKPARDHLTEIEQLRFALGALLGKTDLQLIWPVDLVLFPTQRELAPHALPEPFVEGGSAALATWTADTALPRDFLRQLTQRFLDANAGRMPEATELALQDLFSTIQVNATKVSLGAPLKDGELPPDRLRAWAKLQMLVTQPAYSGKVRVYLNNLQQNADEDVASRNAFAISAAELNQRADAYLKAGNFAAAPVNGETLAPARDFIEKPFPQTSVDSLFAELKSNGKEYPADSPRGLLDKGTKESIQAAIKANPRWAQPHVALAEQNFEWKDRIPELKVAANLEPRNAALWLGLAKAQAKAEQFADADKSEAQAERAAANETERTQIHQAHVNVEEERAAFAIEEHRRKLADEAALLQKAKDNEAAEIRAAEDASHKRTGTLAPGAVPVPWWQDEVGEKLSGTLTRVDCQTAGPLKLTIQPATGKSVLLLIRDPHNLAVKGAKEANFACGIQKPTRKINLVYEAKPDSKQGTSGDVRVVEFP